DTLAIPYGESQARFLECLDIIRQAWKGERFTYEGKFYQFRNVMVAPRPYQLPAPPMRMAANSPETFVAAGEMGLPIFLGLRDHDTPSLRLQLKAYRDAWRQAGQPGQPDAYVRIPIYAADTESAALDEPRENITYFFRRHAELVRSGLGRSDTGSAT